jgi:hypothetical protein
MHQARSQKISFWHKFQWVTISSRVGKHEICQSGIPPTVESILLRNCDAQNSDIDESGHALELQLSKSVAYPSENLTEMSVYQCGHETEE